MPERTPVTAVLSERALFGTNLAKCFINTAEGKKSPENESRYRHPKSLNRNFLIETVINSGIPPGDIRRLAVDSARAISRFGIKNAITVLEKRRAEGDKVILLSSTPGFLLDELCRIVPVVDEIVAPSVQKTKAGSRDWWTITPADFDYAENLKSYVATNPNVDLGYCLGSGFDDVAVMTQFAHPIAVQPHVAFGHHAASHQWDIIK